MKVTCHSMNPCSNKQVREDSKRTVIIIVFI